MGVRSIDHLPAHRLFSVDQVDVWQAELSALSNVCLSPDEQQRADSIRHLRTKQQFTVGRSLLRQILAAYLGSVPLSLEITNGVHGKPMLVGGALHFNLSHSGDQMLIAVSPDHQVGIDVEHIHSIENIDRIVQDFFAPREIEAFLGLPETHKQAAFFATWARKEAFIKALGSGFGAISRTFAVSIDPAAPPQLLDCPVPLGTAADWQFYDLKAGAGYAACLVIQKK
jgi:4'-phosphopantetheinyl transferase